MTRTLVAAVIYALLRLTIPRSVLPTRPPIRWPLEALLALVAAVLSWVLVI